VLLLFNLAARAQDSPQPDTTRFRCRLRLEKETLKRDEPVRLSIAIENNTSKPQLLVREVYGSEDGRSFPTARMELYRIRKNGARKPVEGTTSCLVFAVSPESFVWVAPGEGLPLCAVPADYTFSNPCFPLVGMLAPGRYELSFTYSTILTPNQRAGLFKMLKTDEQRQQMEQLLTQVPQVELKSNSLPFTITR